MMQRWINIFLVLAIFVFVTPQALAQTPQPGITVATATATSVSYQAPSVTLLPNHPLYKLQLIWDRLSLSFAFQPNKKLVKYVALADRELTAASMVIDAGDPSLGLRSAFRGENYMTTFVNKEKSTAYNTGSIDTTVAKRAHDAYPYHQAILTTMIGKTSGGVKADLEKILEFSQRNEKELTVLEKEYSINQTKK